MTGYYIVTLAHRDAFGNGYTDSYAVHTYSSDYAKQHAMVQARSMDRADGTLVACEWVEG